VAAYAAPLGCRVRCGLGRRDTWCNLVGVGPGGAGRMAVYCVQGWRQVAGETLGMLARYADDDEAVEQGGPWYSAQVRHPRAPGLVST
jgi:hypothetical protein